MSFFGVTVSIFLIMNAIGHINGYLELVKSLNKEQKKRIIIREMIFALLIMVFFNYVGEYLLKGLGINQQTVFLAGGLILFLIAIRMIFPKEKAEKMKAEEQEPFIFPIATPMIAGPSALTTIMLYAYQENIRHMVLLAILIAWGFSIAILLLAEQIRSLIGRRSLMAIERLMGLLLTMTAVEMVLNGIRSVVRYGP